MCGRYNRCLGNKVEDKFLPPIRMYSFELWNKESRTLSAAVFTYVIGSIANDFTCLTVDRDSRSSGTLLTRVVSEILKSVNCSLWNWGITLSYMRGFSETYGGSIELSREEFYEKWWEEALGCQVCRKPYEPGNHRRVEQPNLSQQIVIFLCESCSSQQHAKGTEVSLTADIEDLINSGKAPVQPLDFTPIVTMASLQYFLEIFLNVDFCNKTGKTTCFT